MAAIAKPYSLHPSFAHWSAMLASLKERTGKNVEQWLSLLKLSKATTTDEMRAVLKAHDLGASTIGLILEQAAGKTPDQYNPQLFVDNLFKGPKAELIPLYKTVLHLALSLGKDVKACPCATMVPLYRHHVFAQLKPSTKTRLDLGLALGDWQRLPAKPGHPLIDTGGFAKKDRITCRIELSAASGFSQSAKDWLLRAYAADAS